MLDTLLRPTVSWLPRPALVRSGSASRALASPGLVGRGEAWKSVEGRPPGLFFVRSYSGHE